MPKANRFFLRLNEFILIHSFRDSGPVRKWNACCYDVQKVWAKQAVLVVVIKAEAVYNRNLEF